MQGLPARATRVAASVTTRLGWSAVATVIAFGAAGLVTAADHPAGSARRPELTWTADRTVEPQLAAARDDLERLSRRVDALGEQGRVALAQLVARDVDGLAASIAAGEDRLVGIDQAVAALRSRLERIPIVGQRDAELRLNPGLIHRYDLLVSTLALTDGLGGHWRALGRGSVTATRLLAVLEAHDVEAAEAARLGSRSRYADALARLAAAEAQLAEAGRMRDALRNTTDVLILTTWIDRNAALDAALHDLYTALRAARGRVTAEVRAAFEAQRRARENLPPDTRGLIVIMADLARGGLNQAVIAIEEVRGRLDEAQAAVDAAAAASPAP